MFTRRQDQRRLLSQPAHESRPQAAYQYEPIEKPVLKETVHHFSEGPFWGKPVSAAPEWYIMYLCSGGKNFLLWKDADLATALANMGYRKMDPPKLAILPPVRGFHQDYTALANAVRNASDSEFLLMTDDIDRANTQGPGVRLESATDRSRAYDADMKRKLLGFRSGTEGSQGQRS